MATEFNYAAFHRRRSLVKLIGLLLVLVGLFTIVDLMATIPIPLTGYRAVFVGMVLLLAGLVALYRGYKLPIEEAINLVHSRARGITESELVHEMRVDRPTARRILNALIRKGFLRPSTSREGLTEEIFEPVR